MYILTSSDNNYIQHLGVMLVSLLENCKKEQPKEVAIINESISKVNIDKLKLSLEKYNVPVRFINFQNDTFRNLKPKNGKTIAAFNRIFISEFYPPEINSVLYLDCDIIIRKDLSDLFHVDLSGYVAAAVQNNGLHYQKQIGMPEDKTFFNSGVLLVNLKNWKEQKIQKKLVDFINVNFDRMLRNDQDALNAVLFDKWLSLSPTWNTHLYFFTSPGLCEYDQTSLKQILKDPSIVHYTTNNKPWHYFSSHPFKNDYYHFLRKTAWRDYKPADKSFNNVIKKKSLWVTSRFYKCYKSSRRIVKNVFLR